MESLVQWFCLSDISVAPRRLFIIRQVPCCEMKRRYKNLPTIFIAFFVVCNLALTENMCWTVTVLDKIYLAPKKWITEYLILGHKIKPSP